jgi:exopolysaccharide biosynthesis polyprenyl glycosylphosphotransferase
MNKASSKKKSMILSQPSHEFCDHELGCYLEGYFHEMLTFERKRSERSGRPFLVMTMNFSGIHKEHSKREAIRDAIDAIELLTRETDIKGWYRSPDVLGVIFTEMNSRETETLQTKMNQNLQAILSAEQNDMIQFCFYRFPDEGKPDDLGLNGSANFNFYPDYPRKNKKRRIAYGIKRIVDVIGSSVGILLCSPFIILIPICIKLTSPGPVLFRQERVGQYEKKFMFLKFRSMHANNDPEVHKAFVQTLIANKMDEGVTCEGGQTVGNGARTKVYKITKDKRVTPFGSILRKTSLDELPQFFNVLKGEMSLVGPRPPIPYELEKYNIWHLRRVLEVKPGITGLWQVTGRSSTTFDEMVRLDLQYANNWSLWLDIKILLKTPWTVVGGKGAY